MLGKIEKDVMKVKDWKLWINTPALFLVFLISPGCMLMHFSDDHHSGMMGHGKETHEIKKEGGHPSAVLLDKSLLTDSQGGMIVEIQFKELTGKNELAFAVKMNGHVIGINQYALDNLATLSNEQGTEVRASRWQSITPSPQRVSGTLYFPDKDSSGNSLLAHGARNVTLRIKEMEGIPERIFQWNLSSVY